MATTSTLSSIQISTTTTTTTKAFPKAPPVVINFKPARLARFRPVRSTPSEISSKVSESIGKAQETCAEDPTSGECVAAWDEVEELSAAASHARDKTKDSDPLEEYCKDNPETDECRTYDD